MTSDMNTSEYTVSITTKDGVKYYNVPLSIEQIAWLIQKRTIPKMPSDVDNEESEKKKLDIIIDCINEINQNYKAIITTMDCVLDQKKQQENILLELSNLKDSVCSQPNGQSIEFVVNTILELQKKLTIGYSLLTDTIKNNTNQIQQTIQSERIAPQGNNEQKEASTDFRGILNNISYNIDQLSRTINAQTIGSSNNNELSKESVYRRLMYKLVDMPVKLYERTAKRLFYKKENNPEYDGNELELVLSFLQRHFESIGLTAIISKPGTDFDASTMEVDDEHEPIFIPGQKSNTVAYTILPRLVWQASSGLPENMINPEKIILCE